METVKWTEEEFKEKFTEEWVKTIELIYYEHNIEEGFYIVKFYRKIK